MIEVIAIPAIETGAKKCPRCIRYHKNDGPEYAGGVICWRCQDTLCHDWPESIATAAVIDWRKLNGLPT